MNIFYTAPTAIRALRREGDEWVTKTNRGSLRLLGSVGEPINPDVWEWYYQVVGNGKCPIVDTWWQTETGGILISPLPGATPLKPGSAAWPFFGIVPEILDDAGNKLDVGWAKDANFAAVPTNTLGNLVITQPWPGMMRTVYGDHERFISTYFSTFPGKYLTGDSASQDTDKYFWIKGRNDDVIKVSGHRLGTEELESALLSHSAVAETAVVAIPNDITGEGICAYVTTKEGVAQTDELKKELTQQLVKTIGPIAKPDVIYFAAALPKTRSGKIMRRLLRKIATGETNDLSDTSTLADPGVLQTLLTKKVS